MALKVKLTRVGRKNNPKYRIVIQEQHSKRDGKYIDLLGFYDPIASPHIIKVDEEKLAEWIKKGATFTTGTARLLKSRKSSV